MKNTHVFLSVAHPGEHGAFHVTDEGKYICDSCNEDITQEFINIYEALKASLKI